MTFCGVPERVSKRRDCDVAAIERVESVSEGGLSTEERVGAEQSVRRGDHLLEHTNALLCDVFADVADLHEHFRRCQFVLFAVAVPAAVAAV